ncbi:MAG: biosynthetic-type acetolactate synthase large subunit [candidate division KSB1 bacterium]|nr:biosynthetic-type acetolactate synthase large subunit [candidate division KSB1 bacterium]MDZ7345716.1 biosynthetic-type acetolactate synthase large subunit [candidate division KSB1 bacterium]
MKEVHKEKSLKGAEIFIECLRREGVTHVFGYPGGAVLPIYDALYDVSDIKHILVRHEQGAVHAAEGYAKAAGKTGVVLVTSGPGATNTVTGIADAYMDSIPLVVFTGQVSSHLIGNDAFQEADTTGITRSITKWNILVTRTEQLAPAIRKAFYIASTGRPGPVVVDMCKDALLGECAFNYPERLDLPGYKPQTKGHPVSIQKAAAAIKKAKRPLIYAGGGVIFSDAAEQLTRLARTTQIPVTLTLHGLGGFPGSDPLFLGMLGMHGTFAANMAVSNCDCLIAVGARFDDRVTGKLSAFAVGAVKIHIDIDPSSINKNLRVEYPIVGDAREVLAELNDHFQEPLPTEEWLAQIDEWRRMCPLELPPEDGRLRPQTILKKLSDRLQGRVVVTTDVGQNQMWTAQYFTFEAPRSHITSGGLGTMGFSLPAAIGAAFGVVDRPIISISGDGGFQMNIQELITASYNKLPIKFIIFNNNYLGMVRQWQELFHDSRFSFTDLTDSNPDFVKVAEGMGCRARRIVHAEEVDEALDWALAVNDGPVVLEFVTVKEEMVFPMVPSGAAVSEMILKRLDPQRFEG